MTFPLDPALITEAETLEQAFEMAYDAMELLRSYRVKRAEVASKVTHPPKAERNK